MDEWILEFVCPLYEWLKILNKSPVTLTKDERKRKIFFVAILCQTFKNLWRNDVAVALCKEGHACFGAKAEVKAKWVRRESNLMFKCNEWAARD